MTTFLARLGAAVVLNFDLRRSIYEFCGIAAALSISPMS